MATQFRPREGAIQLAAPDPGHKTDALFWLSGEVRAWEVPWDDNGTTRVSVVHGPVVRLWLPRKQAFASVAFDGRGRILGVAHGSKNDTLDELRKQIEE